MDQAIADNLFSYSPDMQTSLKAGYVEYTFSAFLVIGIEDWSANLRLSSSRVGLPRKSTRPFNKNVGVAKTTSGGGCCCTSRSSIRTAGKSCRTSDTMRLVSVHDQHPSFTYTSSIMRWIIMETAVCRRNVNYIMMGCVGGRIY